MSFRDALLQLCPKGKQAKLQAALGKREHRIVLGLAERIARRHVERATGQKLPKAVDWSKWLELLKTAIPLILQLLALFGV